MGLFRRREVPGNARVVSTVVYDPDAWSIQAASLGMVTNTYSPASAGVHSPGAGNRGFVGDAGFGVNRWAGKAPFQVQQFGGAAVAPIAVPKSQRLGAGAGVGGQPGLPSTGANYGLEHLTGLGG